MRRQKKIRPKRLVQNKIPVPSAVIQILVELAVSSWFSGDSAEFIFISSCSLSETEVAFCLERSKGNFVNNNLSGIGG